MTYHNDRPYDSHPQWFCSDADACTAQALFNGICAIGNGYLPDLVDEMTGRLVSMFDGVPEKDGIKRLGCLSYHRSGLIASSKPSDVIPVQPFEVRQEDEKTDGMADRAAYIQKIMQYDYTCGNLVLKQLKYEMTGKARTAPPDAAVGRTLKRLQSIVDAAQDVLDENPDIDVQQLGIARKADRILYEDLDPYRYYVNYSHMTVTNRHYPDDYGAKVSLFRVSYMDGDTLSETAKALSSGTLTPERINNAMSAAKQKIRHAWFVPIHAIVPYTTNRFMTADYVFKLKQWCDECMGRKPYDEKTLNHLASGLLHDRVDLIAPVYDAIQAYTAMDSIADGRTREYLYATGRLVRDWKPDPDLWLKAASMKPLVNDKTLHNCFKAFTDEVLDGAAIIADTHLKEAMPRFRDWLSGKEYQSIAAELLAKAHANMC